MPAIRQVAGHIQQLAQLQVDLEHANIAHAYLFSGPANVGKLTAAYWFAAEVLTLGLAGEKKAGALHQIERLTHPDLLVLDQLWIEKVCEDWDVIARRSNVNQEHRSKKDSRAKTDIIRIDDIRVLQERLHETSVGRYRCCIINSVERMQDAAANAFLKILEEPPEGLVFLLTTQKQSALLPTIRSRVRTLQFSPLSRKELQPLLKDLSDNDAHFILRLAQGAPGIVQRLRSDPEALRLEKQLYNQALTFWDTVSLRQRLRILSPLHDRGAEADRLLLHLALALRQQQPGKRSHFEEPFLQLSRDLQTNTHRQLVTQRFALVTAP